MPLKRFCFQLTIVLATPAFSQPNLTPSVAPAPVLVRFHVELGDQLVKTLTKDDFILLEDGRPQSITAFWGAQPDSSSALTGQPKPLVELIFLLDSTAAPGSVADPRGPVSQLLDIGALARMVADPHQQIRVAVYGFGSRLKRFCSPTHDANTLSAAFAGATGEHYGPQHEIQRRPNDVDPGPLPDNRDALPGLRASPVIPAPGEIIPLGPLGAGHRPPHEPLSWDEALIATAQDVAREPSNATRMIVPLFVGLPQPDSDPEAVAKAYQELGIALYPRVPVRAWILREEWVLRHGGHEPQGMPGGMGLDWKSLAAPQKLARLDPEDSLTKRYEALGEQTGGMPFLVTTRYRSIAEMLADEAPSVYIAEFVPPNSGTGLRHKVEVRLRDDTLGKVVGGIRLTQ